ncbi:MAG: TetR/AcrR family transcriptional regulator [Bdellovibrionales bacterium]
MRQKTDKKRQQILQVASKLFLKNGLDAVSMSQIAVAVGGSKSTLYGYFQNKEELFLEVVLDGIAQMVEKGADSIIEPSLPLFEKLRLLGAEYLTFILTDDSIAMRRMVTAVSNRKGAGRQAFQKIIHDSWSHVAALIEEGMKTGQIKKGDPWQAATHLKRLFEYDLLDVRLLDSKHKISAEKIDEAVDLGLKIFKSYYGKK